MAVFWLGFYVFVNLTAILWLGALAINTIAGVDNDRNDFPRRVLPCLLLVWRS